MIYKEYKCGEEIIHIPKPESYKDCVKLAQSDCYRYTGKVLSPLRIILSRNYILRFSFWLRMSSYNGFAHPICNFLRKRMGDRTGLQISYKTPIGYGFYIGHGFGVIINPTAVIGNNCNISQFTTIGSNRGKAAIIGNNVYIGPSVCIVENIYTGSDVTIGAGAVVTKDIPSNTTIAGVPAKIISKQGHKEFIINKWQKSHK